VKYTVNTHYVVKDTYTATVLELYFVHSALNKQKTYTYVV